MFYHRETSDDMISMLVGIGFGLAMFFLMVLIVKILYPKP